MCNLRRARAGLLAGCVAASLGCSESKPSEPTPSECPPFSVEVDGAAVPELRPRVAIGEVMNAKPALSFAISAEPHDCSIESLRVVMADVWPEGEPGISVYSRAGELSVAVRGSFKTVEGTAASAPPAKGESVSVCIRSGEPVNASSGPLAGKSVLVRGEVTAPYCGARSEIQLYPPGG